MRGGSHRQRSRLLVRLGALLFVLWFVFSLLRMPTSTREAHPFDDHVHDDIRADSNPVSPLTVSVQPTASPLVSNVDATAAPKDFTTSTPFAAPVTRGSSGDDTIQLEKVKEAIRHSWDGYRKNAFGKDEYLPISNSWRNWGGGNGIGVTMIDSLDTLLMAGLNNEANEVMDHLETHLSFDQDIKVSVFETTIRVLGGLISSYQLTGRDGLKRLAVDLGNRLLKAFDTNSGVPDNYVNLRTGRHEGAAWNGGAAILSELGSLQMEFRALSDITGDMKYDNTAQRAIQVIKNACHDGFCPKNFRGRSGQGGNAGLGSFGDSFYEYLLKYWLQTGESNHMYKEMWDSAANHIVQTSQADGRHLVPNGKETGMTMEHLACFSGGLFALSSTTTHNQEHLTLAEGIAETCHDMYQSSATKLSPDVVHVHGGGFSASDPKYILRPETVETYFYLWRVTKNPKYREWGAEVLDACNKHLRVARGYIGSNNVHQIPVPTNDMLETFWIAETLKYLLLLFSDDSAFDFKTHVFNTEAHPFRIVRTA